MIDRGSLPYTCAFIQELYRYRTMAPLSIFRTTTTDVEINGYIIPKDTTVSPFHYQAWALMTKLKILSY